ncbi:MAG TPA: hypothetical protein DCP28_38860, partial [Cytophagales bacterium]|nr:hypothetical protein [Cytophagales bacterium]
GSQYVHRSRDEGKTWQIISPDLTTNRPEQQHLDYGGLTPDASGAEFYNCLLSIAPSPLDEQVIWTGSDDGRIHVTTDGGKNWTAVEKNIKGMPEGAWVARIIASEHEASTAWAVVNDYRRGNYAPYLFKTDDYGRSWTSRVEEESPVYGYSLSFIQDPEEPALCFLGTENGLWVSFDEGENWEVFGQGFPAVSTMDLKIQRAESALVIGTFGRAVWVVDDLLSLRELAGDRLGNGLTALPVNDAVQVKGLFIRPTGTIWNGFHTIFQGDNRPFWHTPIPYYISEVTPGAEVTAVVISAVGDTLQTLASTVWEETPMGPALVAADSGYAPAVGLHYLDWQLDQAITL